MISLLVIFTLGLFLAGCSTPAGEKSHPYGTLVYDSPDSLLQVVTRIDTTGMSIEEKHHYNLMYTAAMYRTGMCIEDTSVIKACEDYFTASGDKESAALSKLYHAENAYHQFDYYKAVRKAMEALNIIREEDYYPLKYNLFNLLCRINNETDCTRRAEEACRKAAENAAKGGHANQMADARNTMAAMLIGQDRMGEAEKILNNNYNETDKRIISEYYRIRGLYMLRRDSIGEARNMLKKAEQILPTAETFYDLAQLYLKTNKADSCLNYCHFATTADRRGYVSIKAYNIIIENFSNNLGIGTLRRICADLNQLHLKRAETSDAIKIDALQSTCEQDDDGSIIYAVILLLLVAAAITIYLKNKKTKVSGDTRLLNENIVYELRKQSSQGKNPTQEQWIALHRAANKHIPFFLEHLHKINDLTARDINICLLTRLHFSPSEIAVLTDISPQSVTNTRSRLLGKIFGIKGGASEFDRRIGAMR